MNMLMKLKNKKKKSKLDICCLYTWCV